MAPWRAWLTAFLPVIFKSLVSKFQAALQLGQHCQLTVHALLHWRNAEHVTIGIVLRHVFVLETDKVVAIVYAVGRSSVEVCRHLAANITVGAQCFKVAQRTGDDHDGREQHSHRTNEESGLYRLRVSVGWKSRGDDDEFLG